MLSATSKSTVWKEAFSPITTLDQVDLDGIESYIVSFSASIYGVSWNEEELAERGEPGFRGPVREPFEKSGDF